MKKCISLCLCIALLLCMLPCATFATGASVQPHTTVIQFEDGSYCITTIIQEEILPSSRGTAQTKTGTREMKVYNANNVLQLTLRIRGTFTYDGTTATATSAQYSYTISQESWKFVSANASRNGATATVVGTFRNSGSYNRTFTVSLTCSPTGVLS